MTSPMVSTDWLVDHLGDPDIRIVEISSKKNKDDDPYWQGHIPNAIRWFWKDLCWHETDREFVTPEVLAARLGGSGVGPDHTLVLYGDPVQYGNYAFWALTMAGRQNMKLLDGSRKKWLAEGHPVTTDVPTFNSVEYPPATADMSMRVGRDDVRAHLGDSKRFLLDLRSPEEYSGERVMEHGQFDHGAERGGRIPGAKHLFFKELLNNDDTYKSPDEMKHIFASVGAEPEKYDDLVVYCRLSHRATLAWTALAHLLGHDNVKIYDGSWTEWGSIVGFPVEH